MAVQKSHGIVFTTDGLQMVATVCVPFFYLLRGATPSVLFFF